MVDRIHLIRAKVWRYKGNGPWYFVTLEKEDADKIKADYVWPRRGFGSIRVEVRVGGSLWRTSVFPDKDKTFVLPIKKKVRMAENIGEGDEIEVGIEVVL